MSDRQKNHVLIVLGIVTSFGTIAGTVLQVGSLKGEIITTMNVHTKELDRHDSEIREIQSRLHGIASQVGKVPGRVAAKIQDTEGRP